MIGIDFLYRRTNNDLIDKGKSGYSSNEEFNRDIIQAQNILMTWHIAMLENNDTISESLLPFIKEVLVSKSGASLILPDDYRHRIELLNIRIDNPETCLEEPLKILAPILEMQLGEENLILTSPIRKPTNSNPRYSLKNATINVYPEELLGGIYLKYITNPPEALRAVTLNIQQQQEDYDSANSTDLVWPQAEISNFVSILLFMRGIQIKDNEVVQWSLQGNQQIFNNIT